MVSERSTATTEKTSAQERYGVTSPWTTLGKELLAGQTGQMFPPGHPLPRSTVEALFEDVMALAKTNDQTSRRVVYALGGVEERAGTSWRIKEVLGLFDISPSGFQRVGVRTPTLALPQKGTARQARLEAVSAGALARQPAPAALAVIRDAYGEADLRPRATLSLPGGVPLTLIWIEGGTFLMGSPPGEKGRFDDEQQHQVTLTRGFWIGQTPVTQAQWRAVMGDNPSHFKGFDDSDERPVEQVSWDDCQLFCGAMEKLYPGVGWRPPTEAQWEYACRAGTTDARYGELGAIAWWGGNSDEQTHPVGQKQPNPWGLYDMLGNVDEWCLDGMNQLENYAPDPVVDPVMGVEESPAPPRSSPMLTRPLARPGAGGGPPFNVEGLSEEDHGRTEPRMCERRSATPSHPTSQVPTSASDSVEGDVGGAAPFGGGRSAEDRISGTGASQEHPDGSSLRPTANSAPSDSDSAVEGSSRVIRGGSWSVIAGGVRAAFRLAYPPGDRRVFVGFRLAGG